MTTQTTEQTREDQSVINQIGERYNPLWFKVKKKLDMIDHIRSNLYHLAKEEKACSNRLRRFNEKDERYLSHIFCSPGNSIFGCLKNAPLNPLEGLSDSFRYIKAIGDRTATKETLQRGLMEVREYSMGLLRQFAEYQKGNFDKDARRYGGLIETDEKRFPLGGQLYGRAPEEKKFLEDILPNWIATETCRIERIDSFLVGEEMPSLPVPYQARETTSEELQEYLGQMEARNPSESLR